MYRQVLVHGDGVLACRGACTSPVHQQMHGVPYTYSMKAPRMQLLSLLGCSPRCVYTLAVDLQRSPIDNIW